jgi:hypothetical protein
MFYRSAIITITFASLILMFQCSDEINRVFKKVMGMIR